MSVHFSSKTDDWATPQDLFDQLNTEFNFTRDVCASDKNHKCDYYWTKEDNAFSFDWAGRLFMNPPYGREIGKWIERAATCKAELVVGLVPARTDTRWWHDYIQNKAEVRFIRGRLKFGDSKNSAPFPSAIVIFRP